MKSLFYDLESTGVYPHQNGIHQIGGIVVIGDKVVEEFDIRVQPHPKSVITDEALAIAGITREDLATYQAMEDGYKQLISIVSKHVDRFNRRDKFHLIGYNNRAFDDQFLRRFFEYNGDNYFGSYFWPDSIDVLPLMSYALRDKRHKMENFKLGTVCNFIGVPFDDKKAHDALYDVRKTRELYNLIDLM